jgi:hypothetical protein
MKTLTPAARQARAARFMPNGIPRYVRCYRDDAYDWDKWCVVFTGRAAKEKGYPGYPDEWPTVGLSGHSGSKGQPADTIPEDGKGYIWPPAMGRKGRLGVRVPFTDLPASLRAVALEDYREIWRC